MTSTVPYWRIPSEVASFHSEENNVTAIVTQNELTMAWHVALHDDDAEMFVGTVKIFPQHMRSQAIAYAQGLAQ